MLIIKINLKPLAVITQVVKNLSNFLINKNIKSFIQLGSSGEYGKIKSPQKENLIGKPKLLCKSKINGY